MRWEPYGAPDAVFCYSSGQFAKLLPRHARYTGALDYTHFEMVRESNWRAAPLLSAAPVATRSWLVLRDAVSWESA